MLKENFKKQKKHKKHKSKTKGKKMLNADELLNKLKPVSEHLDEEVSSNAAEALKFKGNTGVFVTRQGVEIDLDQFITMDLNTATIRYTYWPVNNRGKVIFKPGTKPIFSAGYKWLDSFGVISEVDVIQEYVDLKNEQPPQGEFSIEYSILIKLETGEEYNLSLNSLSARNSFQRFVKSVLNALQSLDEVKENALSEVVCRISVKEVPTSFGSTIYVPEFSLKSVGAEEDVIYTKTAFEPYSVEENLQRQN